ncbi:MULTISPECIES: hypothetical protein [unclassified Streptomyces]|uniref:hypothetical protein n=1 Tax=unclassified Streptomyces TaxID=2593676 RepID=UPI0035E376B2
MRADTNGFISSARYVWRNRVTAIHDRHQGRRDAPGLRDRIAALPHPDDLPHDVTDQFPELLTPHVQGIRASASRGADQLRARLLHDERELCARIHSESVRVATRYEEPGESAPAALARYGELIGVWRASAGVCRSRAAVLTHEANQRLARYWTAVLTSIHPLPEEGEFPSCGPHWLPGRVVLDESWQHTDDWLRGDGGLWPSPAPDRADHPVTRALAVLDAQPVRRAGNGTPAGAGRGHG